MSSTVTLNWHQIIPTYPRRCQLRYILICNNRAQSIDHSTLAAPCNIDQWISLFTNAFDLLHGVIWKMLIPVETPDMSIKPHKEFNHQPGIDMSGNGFCQEKANMPSFPNLTILQRTSKLGLAARGSDYHWGSVLTLARIPCFATFACSGGGVQPPRVSKLHRKTWRKKNSG